MKKLVYLIIVLLLTSCYWFPNDAHVTKLDVYYYRTEMGTYDVRVEGYIPEKVDISLNSDWFNSGQYHEDVYISAEYRSLDNVVLYLKSGIKNYNIKVDFNQSSNFFSYDLKEKDEFWESGEISFRIELSDFLENDYWYSVRQGDLMTIPTEIFNDSLYLYWDFVDDYKGEDSVYVHFYNFTEQKVNNYPDLDIKLRVVQQTPQIIGFGGSK